MPSATVYDPRIGAFTRNAQERWGDQRQNQKNLIRYWMCPEFDNAVYGLRMNSGELIGVQAQKKKRKTTLVANWILNFARQIHAFDAWIAVDTLESGMPPTSYADVLLAMMATKVMIGHYFGVDRMQWPSAQTIMTHSELGPQLRLDPDFFLYTTPTAFQKKCIEAAQHTLDTLPISLFGPAHTQGEARNLAASIKRWELLYEGKYPGLEGLKHRIFVFDNIQQYVEFAGNSYLGLEIVTNAISTFIVTHPGAIGIGVSQVSLTSARATTSDTDEMEARGGSRFAEECNTVYQTGYNKNDAPLYMTISCPFSRRTPPPTIHQDMEPFSGAFLRPARVAHAIQ